MKKKTVEIGPPQIKFKGINPNGQYMIEIRFNIKSEDEEGVGPSQRGIGIYIDPEKIWMMIPSCQTPYVDAKFYEVVNAPTYKEQFDQYYDEVEVIRLDSEKEEKEDTRGMVQRYDGSWGWL